MSGSNNMILLAYLLILNTCSIACTHTSLLWPIDILTDDVRAMRCRESWRLDVQCRFSLPCKIWPCFGLWFLKARRVAGLAVGYNDILIYFEPLLAFSCEDCLVPSPFWWFLTWQVSCEGWCQRGADAVPACQYGVELDFTAVETTERILWYPGGGRNSFFFLELSNLRHFSFRGWGGRICARVFDSQSSLMLVTSWCIPTFQRDKAMRHVPVWTETGFWHRSVEGSVSVPITNTTGWMQTSFS